MEFKVPRPTPHDGGGPAGKRRPHAHTISGRGKKLWPLLPACQTRIFLGISINYRYDLDNERWFGRGASIEKFKEKSCQRILNFDGEIVWSSLIQDSSSFDVKLRTLNFEKIRGGPRVALLITDNFSENC
jgi:hypothetical protein